MSPTRILAIGGYLAAGLCLAALELAARRNGSRLPTLGHLCGYALRFRSAGLPVGRIAGYAVWCWLGWHLFAR